MEQSILKSVKKFLGLDAEYDAFDQDVLMHINTVLSTLNQIGVGPEAGFLVESDSETWNAFLGDDNRYNAVRTYVFLRVRYLFDPPTTSFMLSSMKEQYQELEWRLNITREGDRHPLEVNDDELLRRGAS